MNVLVQNVSLVEGMAGSMRVKNILEPLFEDGQITLSNLALTHTYEKSKIGEHGNHKQMPFSYIGYNSPFNIREIREFYCNGIAFLKKHFKEGDVNILYNYGYPDIKNYYLLRKAKKIGYKVVFDIVEDNRTFSKYSGLLGWVRVKSSLFFLNRISDLADGVIVISEHLKMRMNEICREKTPVRHIPITVNLKNFPQRTWNPNPDSMKVFYGGSFFLGKDGMEYLISAFKTISRKYPKLSLLLSGKSVVKEEMEKILHLISDCPQIKYLGYLSNDEYFETLNSCDIFCMPRNNSKMAHSGFPFKLGEFLATGRAIIATNVGDVPMYLQDKRNALLIQPESETAIEDALRFCIDNPNTIIEIGAEARKVAENVFSSDILSKKTLTFFKDISE